MPAVLKATIEKEMAHGADASIVHIVDSIIKHAYEARASDIHIDPHDLSVRIRIRVDGVLQELCTLPKAFHESVEARIKVMAGLRTDEHQASQDGRLQTMIDEKNAVDIRLSIIPTYYGENGNPNVHRIFFIN